MSCDTPVSTGGSDDFFLGEMSDPKRASYDDDVADDTGSFKRAKVDSSYGGSLPYPTVENVCKDFQNGVCHRGSDCKFVHSGAEEQYIAPQEPQPCKEFIIGKCARGASCKFQHVAMPAGPISPAAAGVCKDFLAGRCMRGMTCKFAHDGEAPPPPSTQPICQDFQNGTCHRGAGCRFLHAGTPAVGGSVVGQAASVPSVLAPATMGAGMYADPSQQLLTDAYMYNLYAHYYAQQLAQAQGYVPVPAQQPAAAQYSYSGGSYSGVSAASTTAPVYTKPAPAGICRDYMNGRCIRGSGCKFAHEGDAPPPPSVVPICQDFKNGLCTRGNGCRFLHS